MKRGENSHLNHRERMRTRYLKNGPNTIQDHELLEMLLFGFIKIQNTNPTAHFLLNQFGSLSKLIEADPQEIMQRGQVSEGMAVFLSSINELMRRCKQEKQKNWNGKRPLLDSPKAASKFAQVLLSHMNHEVFYIILLDAGNRLIQADRISEGTVNKSYVDPRLIMESALRYKACKVILAHNHPSGTAEASTEDIALTIHIFHMLGNIGIPVVDHLIVAEDEVVSLASKGILSLIAEDEKKSISTLRSITQKNAIDLKQRNKRK